uniref:Uncharacterized protein n=1 Tax=Cacopsylla melanoneura TaxID=428564 RepID=A0A8D8RQ63_9HEMI
MVNSFKFPSDSSCCLCSWTTRQQSFLYISSCFSQFSRVFLSVAMSVYNEMISIARSPMSSVLLIVLSFSSFLMLTYFSSSWKSLFFSSVNVSTSVFALFKVSKS